MTRRKFITRIALCLLLGLISTVAVAWGFAARGSVGVWSVQLVLYENPDSGTSTWNHAWKKVGIAGIERGGSWMMIPVGSYNHSSSLTAKQPMASHWGLSDQARARRVDDRDCAFTIEWAFGWPFPALWTYQDEAVDGTIKRAGIDLPFVYNENSAFYTTAPQALPIYPIWRGLLLDTGFFAAIWAIPMFGVPAVRARHRRKRGLCPNCAYDLGGDLASGCPECGWGRDGKKTLGTDAGIA